MATLAPAAPAAASDDRFFMRMAIAIALTIVVGFSLQFALGRSTFAARPVLHLHGIAFMGWVVLFLTQVRLATSGSLALHRRLGWFTAGWAVLLVVMGLVITVDVARLGRTPFFFQPQYLLVANPMCVFCFALLTVAAIKMRKDPDWHKRLHICATLAISGPGLGRLFPMPLFGAYAIDIIIAVSLLYPLVGMIRDFRIDGRVHPAWWTGVLAIILMVPISHVIANSPVGDYLYANVTAGYPGADVPAWEFGSPPNMQN